MNNSLLMDISSVKLGFYGSNLSGYSFQHRPLRFLQTDLRPQSDQFGFRLVHVIGYVAREQNSDCERGGSSVPLCTMDQDRAR